MKGHSTTTCLVDVLDNIYQEVDGGVLVEALSGFIQSFRHHGPRNFIVKTLPLRIENVRGVLVSVISGQQATINKIWRSFIEP